MFIAKLCRFERHGDGTGTMDPFAFRTGSGQQCIADGREEAVVSSQSRRISPSSLLLLLVDAKSACMALCCVLFCFVLCCVVLCCGLSHTTSRLERGVLWFVPYNQSTGKG